MTVAVPTSAVFAPPFPTAIQLLASTETFLSVEVSTWITLGPGRIPETIVSTVGAIEYTTTVWMIGTPTLVPSPDIPGTSTSISTWPSSQSMSAYSSVTASSLSSLPSTFASTGSKVLLQKSLYAALAGGIFIVIMLLIVGIFWRRRHRRTLNAAATKEASVVDPFIVEYNRHSTTRRVSRIRSDEDLGDIVEIAAVSRNTSLRGTVGWARPPEPPLMQEKTAISTSPPIPPVPRSHPAHAQDAGVRLAGGLLDAPRDTDMASVARTESHCSTLPPPYGAF